jgi:hypothetical protein
MTLLLCCSCFTLPWQSCTAIDGSDGRTPNKIKIFTYYANCPYAPCPPGTGYSIEGKGEQGTL